MRKRVKREKRKENAVLEKQEKTTLNTTRPKSVHNLLKQSGLSPNKASKELQQPLLLAEVTSVETKQTVLERKNKRESIRRDVNSLCSLQNR